MMRQTDAGEATVSLVCETFGISRAAYYEALKPAPERGGDVVKLPRAPRYTAAEVVLAKIREVVGREGSEAWGVRKVWATLRREGLRVSRNAVVERVIRTLKEEVVWLRDWNDIEELRAAIDAWLRCYNERRPHQSLGWKTPAEYRAEHLGADYAAAA